ncbi:hypothetical protein [Stenotrophomonas sp. NPDC077659]|uniref:hypothetical protein n=1 Tax=Stenotrophomonas sp. NPDC077659 TaxID=3390694 RepID=UPI003D067409
MNNIISNSSVQLLHSPVRPAEATTRTEAAKAIDAGEMDRTATQVLAHAGGVAAAPGGLVTTLRAPVRDAVSAGEARTVVEGLPTGSLIGPASVQRQQLMERAATLSEAGVRQAVANGANEGPERLKAGTEYAMLKTLAEAPDDGVRQAHVDSVFAGITSRLVQVRVPDTAALEALRANGRLEEGMALSSGLDTLIAMSPEERVERTRTDAMFAMMVLLMTLLMALSETERNQSAQSLIKAEAFVKAAGERLVTSAEEHRKGAAVALGTTVAVAGAGLGTMGYGAARNVKSIRTNERGAINHTRAADQQARGLAEGQTRVSGGRTSPGQEQVLSASGHRTAAAESYAKHGMNTTRNAVVSSGGQSLAQMGNSAGNVAQADGDAKAAEQSRIKENLSQAAEVSRKTAENQQQEAVKARESTDEVRRQLAALGDTEAATRDAITRNIGA